MCAHVICDVCGYGCDMYVDTCVQTHGGALEVMNTSHVLWLLLSMEYCESLSSGRGHWSCLMNLLNRSHFPGQFICSLTLPCKWKKQWAIHYTYTNVHTKTCTYMLNRHMHTHTQCTQIHTMHKYTYILNRFIHTHTHTHTHTCVCVCVHVWVCVCGEPMQAYKLPSPFMFHWLSNFGDKCTVDAQSCTNALLIV